MRRQRIIKTRHKWYTKASLGVKINEIKYLCKLFIKRLNHFILLMNIIHDGISIYLGNVCNNNASVYILFDTSITAVCTRYKMFGKQYFYCEKF